MIRVGVVDDHRSFADALDLAMAATTDVSCVGVVSSVEESVNLARAMAPDALLIDYQLADGCGLDVADRLKENQIEVRLLMVTAHASEDLRVRATAKGIEQVLSKETRLSNVLDAVRGHHLAHASEPTVVFTDRQREVLELMGQGFDAAAIARELFISIHTTRGHIKSVLRLLEAHTQLGAVTSAIRLGYLVPPRVKEQRATAY